MVVPPPFFGFRFLDSVLADAYNPGGEWAVGKGETMIAKNAKVLDYMTVASAAAKYGRTREAFHDAIRRGKLPSYRTKTAGEHDRAAVLVRDKEVREYLGL